MSMMTMARAGWIRLLRTGLALVMTCVLGSVHAAEGDYLLGAGDVLRITVYNNPDLTTEARVSEAGTITFPLVGEVKLAGGTAAAAEKTIAARLSSGGFVKQPQVNVLVSQFQSRVVSVLGSVAKPGRYSLDRVSQLADVIAMAGGATADGSDLVTVTGPAGRVEYDLWRLISGAGEQGKAVLAGGETVYVHAHDVSVMGQVNRPGKYAVVGGVRTVADFLSMAGGVNSTGSETVTVTTMRDGKPHQFDVDIATLFRGQDAGLNPELHRGDTIFVPRAPMFYIYGEVQRPGSYRIERQMTVIQALAQGGGPTVRGTQRNLQLHRRDARGVIQKLTPSLTDTVLPDDVLYVQESLF